MFSLRTLFVAVAIVALVWAALVYRSPLLASLVLLLTLAIAVGSTIAAWRFPPSRGYYGPLAIVLWLYLVVLFYEPLRELERGLLVNQILFRVWAGARDQDWATWHQRYYKFRQEQQLPGFQYLPQTFYEFTALYQTIHCVAAVLLGSLAGRLTLWFERGSMSSSQRPQHDEPIS
jgi:hypothetical protein